MRKDAEFKEALKLLKNKRIFDENQISKKSFDDSNLGAQNKDFVNYCEPAKPIGIEYIKSFLRAKEIESIYGALFQWEGQSCIWIDLGESIETSQLVPDIEELFQNVL